MTQNNETYIVIFFFLCMSTCARTIISRVVSQKYDLATLLDEGCTTSNESTLSNANCTCLKSRYWSDPQSNTCASRIPSNDQYNETYLDKWAFIDEDCSIRPCFNFDANLQIPMPLDYKGNEKFKADFPNESYSGRISTGGYAGGAPGSREALSCRGFIDYEPPWWKWWQSRTVSYKCVLRSMDEYASRSTPCQCPWYKFLGCTGYDVRCGIHGQCFLSTTDMNKYCQPRYGQTLESYGLA